MRFGNRLQGILLVGGMLGAAAESHAAERITLRNGFTVECDHREPLDNTRVRLYLAPGSTNYVDVATESIAASEQAPSLHAFAASRPEEHVLEHRTERTTPAIDTLIQQAGTARRINVDLLRSVVQAESGGHPHAVSRVGARGLMQLMPTTAQALGVTDSFEPEQNLRGGTDYLDSLLRRYHDDLALALAAYNAGPGAVDHYHGVPPYRETRLYVARIIREFNRRTLLTRNGTDIAKSVPQE